MIIPNLNHENSKLDRKLEAWEKAVNKKHSVVSVVPCNFTFIDIQTSLGHITHSSLGFLGWEGVEVVNKRGLVSDLKVPNAAVTLKTRFEFLI